MKKICLLCLIFSISASCVNEPKSESTNALSFPLTIGKRWVYESITKYNDSTVDSFLVYTSITNQFDTTGGTVFEFTDSTNGIVSFDYYQKQSDGLYLYGSSSGGNHVLFKSSSIKPEAQQLSTPILLVPLSYKTNDAWGSIHVLMGGGQYSRFVKYVGKQQVKTKAGTFNCDKFLTTESSNDTCYHYFSQGIGLVKKEALDDSLGITESDSNQTIKMRYVRSSQQLSLNSY